MEYCLEAVENLNLTILECKSMTVRGREKLCKDLNLTILECKSVSHCGRVFQDMEFEFNHIGM